MKSRRVVRRREYLGKGWKLGTLEINQVASTFAAEIRGIDASSPLSARDLDALIGALDRYGVVVMPDQNLTPDQQISVSEQLGPLENSDEGSPSFRKLRENLQYVDGRVSEISNLAQGKGLLEESDVRRLFTFANQLWHSDSTFRPIRARYTTLSAVKVPESGGDTEFADVASSYDALSDEDKEEIKDLMGVHSPTVVMEAMGATRPDGGGFVSEYGTQSRPIVDIHPGSGRKVLNVPSHCSHIEGMSLPEGRSLLTYLREKATLPEFRYRHVWSLGDFVIWDNRSTLHRACRFKERKEARQLVRTVVQDA
ncbi:2,4-dichlorophenoxyacetate dioxygenase [Marinicaulis flavus]|uniref:2,4-dichlorophenoxyacetate dioxygenase n=1 Tax=Hyphococcus luteus TaxID=2058213 RepID=A0A2S7K5D4_9PROT|nr:2,4-dichlorophenoxyacetate dioxygenase [Marinicaulis flavus]